jgi:predicted alpha/beta hydrolase family esterase
MKFLILHGSFGSRDLNWFPWLRSQLEELGHDVLSPQMPVDNYKIAESLLEEGKSFIPEQQTLNNWLEYWDKNISSWFEPNKIVVVGHSIAPVFILHLIEKFNLEFESAIFVSPFYKELSIGGPYEIVNQSFASEEFDFELIKKLLPTSYSIFSDNDPYVNIDIAEQFVQKVGSRPILLKGGEHLGGVLTEFPLVLELCKGRDDYLK